MANLITVGRIGLLFIAIALMYSNDYDLVFLAGWLIGITFLADGVDGWVARRRDSATKLGAVLDIAGDRVVENALWVVFAQIGVIPIWVPLVVLTRSFMVDGVRAVMLQEGMTPFGESTMMRSPFTRFLTSSRFSRAYYGWSKGIAFVLLAWLVAWELPGTGDRFLATLYDSEAFRGIVWFLVYSSVAICVIRGLPVLYDAMHHLQEPESEPPADNVIGPDHTLSPMGTEQSERGRPV